ncbi:hypothetical protein PR048_008458 [Dryococelus australis]|uniref:Ig-like domain-containing protein n=1 Tax=Dryococelus australis TaxID=614101 RepID=A0ABQ9HX65_9NEOP|nr:hypothetical protein PR048_008458 [Dryococelus australis]
MNILCVTNVNKHMLIYCGVSCVFFRVIMKCCALTLLLLLLLVWGGPRGAHGRKGRGRGRTKSKVQIGLPITGQYRDPESDQYYNNNNVIWSSIRMKGQEKRKIPEKTRRPVVSYGTIPKCENPRVTQPGIEPGLPWWEGAKILVASHFDYEYTLGHKIAFMCVARGSPRPQITWFKDGIELYAHSYLHIHEWKMEEDKVKSKLEIDPATQMDAGLYECYADNMYSIDRRSFKTDFSIVFD